MNRLKDLRQNQRKTIGESASRIGDVALALSIGPGARTEPSLRFCHFPVPLTGHFELTKTPRESYLAAYDHVLVNPSPSHAPYRS